MGHGDEIVITDGNFPCHTISQNVIRADGLSGTEILKAVMELFPLDTYNDQQVFLMEVVTGDSYKPEIWNNYKEILQSSGETFTIGYIERLPSTKEPKIICRHRYRRRSFVCQHHPEKRSRKIRYQKIMNTSKSSLLRHNGLNYLLPFILITACFALWGFANDITNPMVKAFSKIFRMSVTEGAMVQLAFYGGYFAMAFPAAIFIRKFSYKKGIMLGLLLYAVGAFLFIPAKESGSFYPFLAAYFILTCGLSFLETSANPYILTMGPEESSTRRLNLAQSFNPIGSLMGMYVAMNFIQSRLNPMSTSERATLSDTEVVALKQSDLSILIAPYLVIGL